MAPSSATNQLLTELFRLPRSTDAHVVSRGGQHDPVGVNGSAPVLAFAAVPLQAPPTATRKRTGLAPVVERGRAQVEAVDGSP